MTRFSKRVRDGLKAICGNNVTRLAADGVTQSIPLDFPIESQTPSSLSFNGDDALYFTRREIEHKILHLSTDEYNVLSNDARINAARSNREYTPKELINEAFVRAIAGDRRWRRGFSATAFFAGRHGVMRSIVSGLKSKRMPTTSLELFDDKVHANSLDACHILEGMHILKTISDAFSNDPVGLNLALAIANGFRGAELQRKTNLNSVLYETKRKVVMQKLKELREEGKL